ncbi:hypothetical protein [Mesorhizobium sp. B1-1-6]|uniref:hypothetical protein n=1 Tax=Mesorhizobium sp. B1-1-6 TaxID=2589978 RepID=UPI0011281F85|nr:hypothetical protein [Mesorhizobium sp. B1-1-6]TPN34799.1 hypothetical protein FJ979_21680 [Mesorhizobium sp. B1-1-6]
MTIKLGSLAADLKKEREGDWIEPREWGGLNPEKPYEQTALPGLAFLVRSTNYPPYTTARQAALEDLKKNYPDDKVPPEVQARIEGELSVQHLLLGWKGLDIEYSTEFAGTILVAEEHRVMRGMIFWCAGQVGKKKVEFVEAATKN